MCLLRNKHHESLDRLRGLQDARLQAHSWSQRLLGQTLYEDKLDIHDYPRLSGLCHRDETVMAWVLILILPPHQCVLLSPETIDVGDLSILAYLPKRWPQRWQFETPEKTLITLLYRNSKSR